MLVALVAFAVAAGCSTSSPAIQGTTTAATSSSSASSSSSSGAGGGAPAPTYGTSACGTCVAKACASTIGNCSSDPGCAMFLTCLDACKVTSSGDADPACVAACPIASSTETQMAVDDVQACRAEGAGNACAACAAPPPTKYTAPALTESCPTTSTETNPCYICDDLKCCKTYAACHADADCTGLEDCIAACPTATSQACTKTCAEQHAEGANKLGPYFACGIVECHSDQPMCVESTRDACRKCVYETCGNTYALALSAPDGFALLTCIEACAIDDSACDATCYDMYPDALPAYQNDAACVGVACATPCGM